MHFTKSCIPALSSTSQSQAGFRESVSSWTFGLRVRRRWPELFQRWSPYALPLEQQQGLLTGTTEAGIEASLLQLAALGAGHGWNVLLFDAQGSASLATRFVALLRQCGCARTIVFPNQRCDLWQGSQDRLLHRFLPPSFFRMAPFPCAALPWLAAVLHQDVTQWQTPAAATAQLISLIMARGHTLEQETSGRTEGAPDLFTSDAVDLSSLPCWHAALSFLLDQRRDEGSFDEWTFDSIDGAYLSFDAWSRPEHARYQAHVLLADLAGSLVERPRSARRVLVLLRHPDLLFDAETIRQLAVLLEQAGGSAFFAVRSLSDLGAAAPSILHGTSTFLLHRSPASEVLTALAPRDASAFRLLPRLDDHDCLAISRGQVALLRVQPPPIEAAALLSAAQQIPPAKEEDPFAFLAAFRQLNAAWHAMHTESHGQDWRTVPLRNDPLHPLEERVDEQQSALQATTTSEEKQDAHP